MRVSGIFISLNLLIIFTLVVLSPAGVAANTNDDTSDDSINVARSNVVTSMVDPSFWEERESLTIGKVKKPLFVPTEKITTISPDSCTIECNSTGGEISLRERAVLTKSQEVALVLVNIPYYQAGESVFHLDDKQQVQLSSVKYAATGEYYGRTDIASSWVTDFYNAACCEDFQSLKLLLQELPAEV